MVRFFPVLAAQSFDAYQQGVAFETNMPANDGGVMRIGS